MRVRISPGLGQWPESLAAFPILQPRALFAWKAAKLAKSFPTKNSLRRSAELCPATILAKHLGTIARRTSSCSAGEQQETRSTRASALFPTVNARTSSGESVANPRRTELSLKGNDALRGARFFLLLRGENAGV
jgi:hypothetical protein